MTPGGPASGTDQAALRSATRRLALLTAAAVTLALVVVGALVLGVVLREQSAEGNRVLSQAVRDVDDITELPADVFMWQRRPDGSVRRSPRAPAWLPVRAELRALRDGPAVRQHTVNQQDQSYLVRTQRRSDGIVVQAAWSGETQEQERRRLVSAVLLAEVAGLLLSALLGLLLARRAVAPLAEALSRQRRFVADASHELRTPLTLLATRAQLLERGLRGAGSTEAHEQSVALVADSRRLGEVVSDLLFSASLGGHPHRRERVDLYAVATEAVEAARLHAQERGVAVAAPAPGPPGSATVLGVPGPLRRVVDALLDNAVRHTPTGGTVAVDLVAAEEDVVLRVRDDGPGLDPAVASRLFERFAHAPGPAQHGSRAGFGLGLALVREVVESHGGTVSGANEPSGGAVFEVRLPAAPAG